MNHRRHSRGWRAGRSTVPSRWGAVLAPVTVVVLVAAVHVVLSSYMKAPIVEADEFGYLYGAHFLALGGPGPVTATCTTICSSSPYSPGYSLLLAPLWLVFRHTSTVYHAALDVNTALAGLTAWLAYVLAGCLAPTVRPWRRALVALVVAAYPSYLLFGNVVESENLLLPVWLATCILANRAFVRRARGRRASPTWVALGLAGGLLYLVHPSALAATVAVVVVGAWVALSPRTRPWDSTVSLASVASLMVGVMAGLVVSLQLIGYVSAGGPSNTGGFSSALAHLASLHAVAHAGVNTAGQLLYLLAVTGGLVVLAVPLLARGVAGLLRAKPIEADRSPVAGPAGSARFGTLSMIAATSVLMVAVSVLSLGTGGAGRLDITLYGRYNEAVLAPVLVAGAVVGISWAGPGLRAAMRLRQNGAWALPGGLIALAVTAAAVVAARGLVLRGTPQATNVLAAHALFGANAYSSLSLIALAGLGAAVLILVLTAWRLNVLLAAAIIVATFVPSAVAGLSDLSTQSSNVATEQAVPNALVSLANWPGAGQGCVGFDTSDPPADAGFAYFDFRLYDPTQSFAPFESVIGGQPCSELVVSARADLASSLPGAREVVADPHTGEALWVLPGPLQARLASAGWLRPPLTVSAP